MTIREEIEKVLNEAENANLADYFGDDMYIDVRILANQEGDIKAAADHLYVEVLGAGEVGKLTG